MISIGEIHNVRGVLIKRCLYEKGIGYFGKTSEIEINPLKQKVQHNITLTYVFDPELNFFDANAYAINVDSEKSLEVM